MFLETGLLDVFVTTSLLDEECKGIGKHTGHGSCNLQISIGSREQETGCVFRGIQTYCHAGTN